MMEGSGLAGRCEILRVLDAGTACPRPALILVFRCSRPALIWAFRWAFGPLAEGQ